MKRTLAVALAIMVPVLAGQTAQPAKRVSTRLPALSIAPAGVARAYQRPDGTVALGMRDGASGYVRPTRWGYSVSFVGAGREAQLWFPTAQGWSVTTLPAASPRAP